MDSASATPRATASTPGRRSARKCRRASGTSRARPIRSRSTSPLPAGGYFVLEARANAGQERFTVTRDIVLRARRGLHRVAALRPQPHRPGRRAHDLQARRHRAHHDPVAVGAGDGARHDRARRHPHASAVRADLDAAVDRHSDDRRGHPEHVRVGAAGEGQKQAAAAGRRAKQEDPAIRASRRSVSATCSSPSRTRRKRLTVAVAANKEEYRPANAAKVTVDVKDQAGARRPRAK